MVKEESILKGCKEGKRSAQKQLYDQYVSVMFAICLRYAKSQDEAEDLLQEGFLKVFQSINSFRQQGSLEGWIKRIMVNHALNHYKKTRKSLFFEDVDEINELEILDRDEENELTEPIQPEKLLEFIQSLPEGYKMVFNLYVFENYGHKEIAATLNISENTSKTQLMKARRHLQKKVHDFLPKQDKVLVDEK